MIPKPGPANASPVGKNALPCIDKGQNSELSTESPKLATAKELAGRGPTGKGTELAQNAARSSALMLGLKGRELSVAGCGGLLLEYAWLASGYWLHWLLVSILYLGPNGGSEEIELPVHVLLDTASSDISEAHKASPTSANNARLARLVSAPEHERWLSGGSPPAPRGSCLTSQSAMASTDRPLRSWHKTSFHFLLCERVLMTNAFEACWRRSCSIVQRRFDLDCRIGAL